MSEKNEKIKRKEKKKFEEALKRIKRENQKTNTTDDQASIKSSQDDPYFFDDYVYTRVMPVLKKLTVAEDALCESDITILQQYEKLLELYKKQEELDFYLPCIGSKSKNNKMTNLPVEDIKFSSYNSIDKLLHDIHHSVVDHKNTMVIFNAQCISRVSNSKDLASVLNNSLEPSKASIRGSIRNIQDRLCEKEKSDNPIYNPSENQVVPIITVTALMLLIISGVACVKVCKNKKKTHAKTHKKEVETLLTKKNWKYPQKKEDVPDIHNIKDVSLSVQTLNR